MENLRQLLAAIAAAVLVLSVISSANFVGYSAFADDDEDDEEKSNSGRGNDDDEEEEDDDNSGSSNNDKERDDDEDEAEDEDDKSGSSSGKSSEDRGKNRNATSSSSDDDEDDEREDGRSERKIKLEVEDDGVEIEVELEGTTFADGAYDAAFMCDSPTVNMTFADSFEVEDGEGEFEKEIALANGTYTGCQLEIDGTVVASFRTFTVADDDIKEKRNERIHNIVSTANATRIHERHVNANPASPGNYTQGSDYVLAVRGSAEEDDREAAATVNATMSVWKSTRALILLDLTDGTVDVGNKTYDIAVGYALYSIQHGAMRIVALVVDDDSGEVLKLKLRGGAEGNQTAFPIDDGDSLDVSFEGNSGQGRNNSVGGWELELEGTVKTS